jgi:adenosylcobinamide kinase/adenosylcobinamide-phosphate guanylyltransferase
LAAQYGPRVLYIATAEAHDAEMAARIQQHQAERPATWQTLEAPQQVGQHLSGYLNQQFDAILLDCMTLLTSNVLLSLEGPNADEIEAEMMAQVRALLQTWGRFSPPPPLIIVSNEVGMGLVPPTPLGRTYRDLLGRVNQHLAQRATRVLFMVAGLPMEMKPLELTS